MNIKHLDSLHSDLSRIPVWSFGRTLVAEGEGSKQNRGWILATCPWHVLGHDSLTLSCYEAVMASVCLTNTISIKLFWNKTKENKPHKKLLSENIWWAQWREGLEKKKVWCFGSLFFYLCFFLLLIKLILFPCFSRYKVHWKIPCIPCLLFLIHFWMTVDGGQYTRALWGNRECFSKKSQQGDVFDSFSFTQMKNWTLL